MNIYNFMYLFVFKKYLQFFKDNETAHTIAYTENNIIVHNYLQFT